MKAKLPTRVTEAEFLSGPESVEKVELIDGFVVRSPSPTYGHQRVLIRLVQGLDAWATGRAVTVGQCPLDVRFGPDRILQPDAFVGLEPTPRDTKSPLTRVPELCVEVLSRDVRYDRLMKRFVYAEAGVKELWLVSLDGWLERWTGAGLTQSETITGTLRTPLLPGFELDVASLFGER